MTVAVTGAGGFLGSHLVRLLVDSGEDVVAVARRAPERPVPGARYAHTLPEDARVIHHLSGRADVSASFADPRGDLEANAGLFILTLEHARRTRAQVVLGSSLAVYGPVDGAADEDAVLGPVSPYGVSKGVAETYGHFYRRVHGLDVRIGRIANAYGSGQTRNVVYDLVRRALAGERPLRVRGSPAAVRDFVHARDIARALVIIAEKGEPGGVYNVGTGEPVDMGTLARALARAAGLSEDEVEFGDPVLEGKVNACYPRVRRLADLGYGSEVSLEDGIAETVAWARSDP